MTRMLTPDDKSKLHWARKNLEKGLEPNRKNVAWLLDLIGRFERELLRREGLLKASERDNERLRGMIAEMRDIVRAKIDSAFEV